MESKRHDKQSRLNFYTYHASKGLEADIVILIGDCTYDVESTYKNKAYAVASFPTSYDAAQREEIQRLAYVAITRAARRCYWFLDENKEASAALPLAAPFLVRELKLEAEKPPVSGANETSDPF